MESEGLLAFGAKWLEEEVVGAHLESEEDRRRRTKQHQSIEHAILGQARRAWSGPRGFVCQVQQPLTCRYVVFCAARH